MHIDNRTGFVCCIACRPRCLTDTLEEMSVAGERWGRDFLFWRIFCIIIYWNKKLFEKQWNIYMYFQLYFECHEFKKPPN